ncbi:iron reductase [Mycobacterium sp. 852014-52450_SCH5900713]|uniref:(2Fe-2S)-binding protein n=1 Tax=Mycobacterium sp. 852014-52450_SCH5900713 TaxID=1834116 RepID=UPI0007FFEA8A|nr:(2Fe-2S)-binding protein [Mycobacterium sp. 852014-52450_SCH5900713]OBF99746.1 iron reductase [Mycobacterium sp. 852014-52450_SCH5900713]
MDISAELAEIACYKGFFTLPVGDAAGWHPVGRSYADGFTDLIDATARRYRTTDLRVAASLVHLGHATRLWSPVLACALGHGVVPDLNDLQRADDGAQLRLPAPVGIPANSSDVLYRVVVQEHMEPLAAGLRVKLAPALLAGNVASALTGAARALLAVRSDLGPRIAEMTHALLGTGALAGSGVTGPRLGFKRHSCCLFYRLPGRSVCGDCVFEAPPSDRT